MGGADSKDATKIQRLYANFKPISPFNNEFTECQILQHKREPSQRLILREITLTDDQYFKKTIQSYESRHKLNHTHMLNLTNYFYVFEQQLCGQFYKIYLLFDYPNQQLFQKPIPTEEEILCYLKGCVDGLQYMQENNIQHNAITLKSIYFVNNDIKLSDPMYFCHQPNFAQVLQQPNTHEYIYLAPTLVKAIQANNWQPKHNTFKSDVFTLGMTFLHFANNETNSDCYIYEEGILLEDKLALKIKKLKSKYSTKLCDIIQLMLTIREEQRPDFIQLHNYLQSDNRGRPSVPTSEYRQTVSRDNSSNGYRYKQPQFIESQVHTNVNVNISKQLQYQQSQATYIQSQQTQQSQVAPVAPQAAVPQTRRIAQVSQISPLEYVHQYTIKTEASTRSLTPIGQVTSKQLPYVQTPQVNVLPPPLSLHQNSRELPHREMNRDASVPRSRESRHSSKDCINQSNTSYANISYINDVSNISNRHQHPQPFFPPKPQPKQQQLQIQQEQQLQQMQQLQLQQFTQQQEQQLQQQQKQQLYQQQQQQLQKQQLYQPAQQNQQQLYQQIQQQIQKIQTPIKQSPALTLPGDQPDELQSVELLQASSMFAIIDENADPNGEDELIRSQRGDCLKFSKILNDSTNAFHNNNKEFSLPFDLPLAQFQNTSKFEGTVQKVQSYQSFSEQNTTQLSQNVQQTSQQKLEYVTEHYQNGSRYEGTKQNGMRHGVGKFFYSDGGLFDGDWKQNQMHGTGTLYYATGQPAYQGEWFEDQFQGEGTLYNEKPVQLDDSFDYHDFDYVEDYWIKYAGYFDRDNKEGQGTLYLTNGERFVGTFEKDFINGPGIFYCMNGRIVDGRWKNNKMVN